MINIGNCYLIRYVNGKYALKSVIYEGRQFSILCHVETVLEAFPK